MIGTGRSDFPNQINNVLAFPGIFRGALDVRASDINDEMKVAAAYAIANIITDEERNAEYIIPNPFDKRVAKAVAKQLRRLQEIRELQESKKFGSCCGDGVAVCIVAQAGK